MMRSSTPFGGGGWDHRGAVKEGRRKESANFLSFVASTFATPVTDRGPLSATRLPYYL
jgi:hypothetical protein